MTAPFVTATDEERQHAGNVGARSSAHRCVSSEAPET